MKRKKDMRPRGYSCERDKSAIARHRPALKQIAHEFALLNSDCKFNIYIISERFYFQVTDLCCVFAGEQWRRMCAVKEKLVSSTCK